jgi:hypothetical protein
MWITLLEVQKPAHEHFGLGVFALYAAHIVAAGFLAVHIGHAVKLMLNGKRLMVMGAFQIFAP